jgi:alanine racemase
MPFGDQKYRSWVEVDLDNYINNLNEVRRLVGSDVRILQAVKADAYGHGAIEISHVALRNGVSMLGVANADEGVQLRVSGIAAPIVILSPSTDAEIGEIIKYDLTPSVSDLDFVQAFQTQAAKANIKGKIHIEVDTGMGRGGTMPEDALPMIRKIEKFPNIEIEGIFTHLSSSEEMIDYNKRQWQLFRKLLGDLARNRIFIPLKHMSNSGSILNFPQFNLDMVRPGIMTYGIYPSEETKAKATLLPVMSFKTRIILIKEFPKGYSIGYGRSYTTRRPAKIATIPVGYGDGYGIILSNGGEVLIRGKRAPIVGRISMDLCTADITDIPCCQVGDEVVMLGHQHNEYISANELAEKSHTISYDILCALGKRAPRIFLHKGRMNSVEPRLRRIYIPDEEKSISRIDNIIRHCFQRRARNEELGDAIYYEMFETLFGKETHQLELRSNFKYSVNISEFTDREIQADSKAANYFKVTTHVEYIKAIKHSLFLIGCASTNEQLAAFFEDKYCEYRWLLNHGDSAVMEKDFFVQRVRVDGEDIPIVKTKSTKRGYELWCGSDQLKKKLNRESKVEIEIVTQKAKNSNIFSVYLIYPTRGIDVLFDYEGTNLKNVRQISYFAGKHPYPKVTEAKGKAIRLKISNRQWIFPNSGVTFIWDF